MRSRDLPVLAKCILAALSRAAAGETRRGDLGSLDEFVTPAIIYDYNIDFSTICGHLYVGVGLACFFF